MVNCIVSEVVFHAAHRILTACDGQNEYLHGHSFKCVVSIRLRGANGANRNRQAVELKNVVKTWISDHLDHNVILCKDDALINIIGEHCIHGKPYVTKSEPNSEVIATEVFLSLRAMLEHPAEIMSVHVCEDECTSAYILASQVLED